MGGKHRWTLKLLLIVFMVGLAFSAQINTLMAGEPGTFTGTWVANGTRDLLSFGEDRQTSLFKLSGHVNLKDEIGQETDYWAECIGLADTHTGSEVRCVWRSLDGQKIYLTLQGEKFAKGSKVTGKIIGGTEAAAGITGSLQFEWSSMSFQTTNNITTIGGYAKNLSGTFQLP